MTDKASLIAELEQKYVDFRELIVNLPPEAYREVWLGEWSVNQMLPY